MVLQSPDLHEQAWSLLKVTLMTLQTLNITEHCTFSVTVSKAHQSPQGAADGVLVPGGFGHGEVQGKILAAKYARENNVPYVGIGLAGRLGTQGCYHRMQTVRSLTRARDILV